MLGWLSCDIVRASRSKRAFSSGEASSDELSTLMATVRSRRVSRARYTSPMPPAPSADTTSYGPKRVPATRVILTPGATSVHSSLLRAINQGTCQCSLAPAARILGLELDYSIRTEKRACLYGSAAEAVLLAAQLTWTISRRSVIVAATT